MASTQQKPRVVPDPEPEYEPIVGDPVPTNVHIVRQPGHRTVRPA